MEILLLIELLGSGALVATSAVFTDAVKAAKLVVKAENVTSETIATAMATFKDKVIAPSFVASTLITTPLKLAADKLSALADIAAAVQK